MLVNQKHIFTIVAAVVFAVSVLCFTRSIYELWTILSLEKLTESDFVIIANKLSGMLACVGASVFMLIWQYMEIKPIVDYCFFYMSLSLTCWALKPFLPVDWYASLSQINNLFMFLSVSYFNHLWWWDKPNVIGFLKDRGLTRKFFRLWLWRLSPLLILLTFHVLGSRWLGMEHKAVKDFSDRLVAICSMVTFLLLTIALHSTFLERKLRSFSILVWLMFIGFLLAEYLNLELEGKNAMTGVRVAVSLLAYKILLIFLIGIFAHSWLYERIGLEEKAKNAALEKEKEAIETARQKLIHFLRNSLQYQIYNVDELVENLDPSVEQDKIDLVKEQSARLIAMRAVLEDVYMNDNISVIPSLRLYLKEVFEKMKLVFHFADNAYKIELDAIGDWAADADNARDLAKVLTEIVTNAYKYGGRYCHLKAEKQDNILSFHISDRTTAYHVGKKKNEHKGYGTIMIKKYLGYLGGKQTVEIREIDKTISIHFPIDKFLPI